MNFKKLHLGFYTQPIFANLSLESKQNHQEALRIMEISCGTAG